MKSLLISVFLYMIGSWASAQDRIIKSGNSVNYGSAIKILPTDDQGWVVFSMDSMNLTKFNSCGNSEWSKHYVIPDNINTLNDFIKTSDGGFALLTRVTTGIYHSSMLIKMDATGNILWSKSFEDTDYDQFPYSISEDPQENFILYWNMSYQGTSPNYTVICKVNKNGNIIWTNLYDYGHIWGGAIVTSDNGILARTGWIFIKTDNNGNVQWTSDFLTGSYHYLAPVEVSDGYIFSGYTNTGNFISFFKMDKQGNILWGGRKTSNITGVPTKFHKMKNGNFALALNRFAGQVNTTIIEFDKDLNVVKENSIQYGSTGGSFYSTDLSFDDNDKPYIAGNYGGPSSFFFSKPDKNYSTGCDTVFPGLTTTVDPITQNFRTTTVIQHSLSTTNRTIQVIPFTISINTLCKIPKTLFLGNDLNLCKNESRILVNQAADNFDEYIWSTGETTSSITINKPGIYWLKVKDNCEYNELSDTIMVLHLENIPVNLGEDAILCNQTTHILHAPTCDSCTYIWSTGDTLATIPINTKGTYWIEVENYNGCKTNDSIEIDYAKCECTVFFPNAFTPNKDGKNESFLPVYDCDINDYSLNIYNRWGQLVYFTDNLSDGWDGSYSGKPAVDGIYVYLVKYIPVLKGKLNKPITKTGSLALIH